MSQLKQEEPQSSLPSVTETNPNIVEKENTKEEKNDSIFDYIGLSVIRLGGWLRLGLMGARTWGIRWLLKKRTKVLHSLSVARNTSNRNRSLRQASNEFADLLKTTPEPKEEFLEITFLNREETHTDREISLRKTEANAQALPHEIYAPSNKYQEGPISKDPMDLMKRGIPFTRYRKAKEEIRLESERHKVHKVTYVAI